MPSQQPTSFAEFVEAHAPAKNDLPFVHSTRCEFFKSLATTGQLHPTTCAVFKEPLLYFFYGRPAFRPRGGSKPDTTRGLLPVCFVLKPDVIDAHLHRVFPFDSGAASKGLFAPHVSAVQGFGIATTVMAIKKAVTAFFETNEAYFLAMPRTDLANHPGRSLAPVNCYCSLIGSEGVADYDDRRCAFEVQTKISVPLKDNLLTVILPTPFLGEPNIRNVICKEWRSFPVCYNHILATPPSEYVRVVTEKAHDFLKNGGYLNA
jgi:hypothetical protein